MTDNEALVALGNRVRELRTKANLTQKELAEKAGLNNNYLSMLERGDRNPSYLTMLKLAHGLKVPVKKLVE